MTTLLIVEDQSDIVELIRLTLQPLGYLLLEATDGLQALALCERERPDIVLLDAMLPGGIDGYEICRRVRADERLRHATVIMLTARGQRADIEEGARAGADCYVVKPFRPSELLDIVMKVRSDQRDREAHKPGPAFSGEG